MNTGKTNTYVEMKEVLVLTILTYLQITHD